MVRHTLTIARPQQKSSKYFTFANFAWHTRCMSESGANNGSKANTDGKSPLPKPSPQPPKK